jgi:hypothetical protein
MYTKDDAKEFGIEWTSVPYRRGDVRVTLPHIPHGAHRPSTRTRRTMLPWFVGLQDNMSTLEIVESGTWEQLRDAYIGLTASPASPSGLPNRYSVIPFRFTATVEISGLAAISDVLVCRTPWDSLRVKKDRNILLGKDRAAAQRFVSEWRGKAVQAAIEAM